MDPAERSRFDMMLNRPLPGEVIPDDDPVWGDQALTSRFNAARTQMGGGRP